MIKNRVVPLRIPESLDELAAISAREQHTDKAATLRQWIHQGASHYLLNMVADGRVSVGRAAELLDVTLFDLYHLAETHGIELGASEDQRQQSHALVDRLTS